MSNNYSGSCLCGAVRFQIAGEFERFYLCHCEHCRKDTGSAHAANLFSSSAALTWISGEDQVRQYNLPGTRHARAFCTNCGSALPRVPAQGNPFLVVPAGSLNGEVRIRPDAHIFVASRAAWDHELEKIPSVARLPAS
ncbi:MAG: GFA family protein [Pseudomonadota bacterium]|nr:GFA family protein [Pseudomonadota bacterium]